MQTELQKLLDNLGVFFAEKDRVAFNDEDILVKTLTKFDVVGVDDEMGEFEIKSPEGELAEVYSLVIAEIFNTLTYFSGTAKNVGHGVLVQVDPTSPEEKLLQHFRVD